LRIHRAEERRVVGDFYGLGTKKVCVHAEGQPLAAEFLGILNGREIVKVGQIAGRIEIEILVVAMKRFRVPRRFFCSKRVPYRAVVLADFAGEPLGRPQNDKVGVAKPRERNLGDARIASVDDGVTHLPQNAYDAFSAAPGRTDGCGVVEDDNILDAHARSFSKK
jgi:hypothetical protein